VLLSIGCTLGRQPPFEGEHEIGRHDVSLLTPQPSTKGAEAWRAQSRACDGARLTATRRVLTACPSAFAVCPGFGVRFSASSSATNFRMRAGSAQLLAVSDVLAMDEAMHGHFSA
jgi:hypothetical protein